MSNRFRGLVAGAVPGAFYGAVGGAIVASRGSNDHPVSVLADGDKKLPKAACSGLTLAYGAAGTAITGAMIAKAVAGTLSRDGRGGRPGRCRRAFANAYLLLRLARLGCHRGARGCSGCASA